MKLRTSEIVKNNEKIQTKYNKRDRRKPIKHFRDLEVYQIAFKAAMRIYKITKNFPAEEKYSLTDQIRRSSRSVCSNIAEAWRKRRYKAYFKNKLSDAMSEASETQTWLDFSLACGYMTETEHSELDTTYELIIDTLNAMDRKADTFCYHEKQ